MLKQTTLAGILVVLLVAYCNGQMDKRPPRRDMTIDKLIAQAMGGYDNFANKMTASDGKVLAELDMNLSMEQYKALYSKERGRSKRKAVSSTIFRWPKAEVPYKFKPTADYGENDKYMIRVSMREWEKYTCLRFYNHSSEPNYIMFDDGFGCNSELGMVGGPQTLNLDKPYAGCRYKGLYLHEIGHAIGLVHEHQRPIRDNWIDIFYNNTRPEMRVWFNSYNKNEINNYNIPYEFSSVMHYGVTAFSVDGYLKTIQPKPQYASREGEIGVVYAKELSFTDIATVNKMYGCADHCDGSTSCKDGGVLDENCRCICPDGSTDCTVGKPTPDPDCSNLAGYDWKCNVWAKQGECERNPDWMNVNCERACGVCGDAFKDDTATGRSCANLYPDDKCNKWRDLRDCEVNKRWMNLNCKLSCGVCKEQNSTTPTTPKPTTSPKITTTIRHVVTQSSTSPEVTTTIRPVVTQSSVSKTTSPPSSTTRASTSITGTPPVEDDCTDEYKTEACAYLEQQWNFCTEHPDWINLFCRKTCGKCTDTKHGCTDEYKTEICVYLDRQWNFCTEHPDWMSLFCRKTCKRCTLTEPTEKENSCFDQNESCPSWAKFNHCELNPSYMNENCKKSCNRCER